MNTWELIQKLLDLQNAYAKARGAIVTGERLKFALEQDDDIDVMDEKIREPLLEHVGHLPIIATFLYTYIENKTKVDLGRSLIMLSIHDIGETVTGDTIAYKKTSLQSDEENEITRKLLPPELVPFYDEFEDFNTFDAKYAKAIDSLAPILHEVNNPRLTKERFEVYGFDAEKVKTKKTVFFQWDGVLKDIFDVCIESLHKAEKNEPTGFTTDIDLP